MKKIYLASRYSFRQDSLKNWQTNNPILERGEPSIVEDSTNEEWLKIGDGVTPWNDLPWKTGPKGDKGDDYVLTDADLTEIANKVLANFIDVSEVGQ